MTEQDARAQFDSWIAQQHLQVEHSVPCRDMLAALRDCSVPMKQGDCEVLAIPSGATIGEAAQRLLQKYHSS